MAMLCMVMSCVGGEVTVLMEPSKDGDEVWAAEHHRPTKLTLGSERVSGVWIRARKLEGELDVGGRRIL